MLTYSICTLLIILIVTISLSYSYNKEAFEDIAAINATPAPAVPSPAAPAAPATPTPATPAIIPNSMPVSTPSVINPDVSLSDTGYQAMALHKQSNLLNDIQKIVHNEILANRMMDVSVKNAPDNSMGNRCNSDSSMGNSSMGNSSMGNSSMGDSSMGDSSMGNSSMGDSSMGNRCNSDSSDSCDQERMHHDMSKYIKKDEIPCWGCSIDY